jgi:cystathionine gamma-synthase
VYSSAAAYASGAPLCLSWHEESSTAIARFPYTDTLKILEKWGPGCLHLGNGNEADIDELECRLSDSRDRGDPPFVSLFCEFPSNPLLRSPNLRRLRALANEYGFLIVVDETIGTFNNVEVLPWADIVVSSLTKVFSGEANVIAGRCGHFAVSRISA